MAKVRLKNGKWLDTEANVVSAEKNPRPAKIEDSELSKLAQDVYVDDHADDVQLADLKLGVE